MNIRLTISNLCARAAMLLLVIVISMDTWAHDYSIYSTTIEGVYSKMLKGNQQNYEINYKVKWDKDTYLEEGEHYTVSVTFSNGESVNDGSIIKPDGSKEKLTVSIDTNKKYTLVNYILIIKSTDDPDDINTANFSVVRFEGDSPFVVSDIQNGLNLNLLADCVNNGITFEGEYFKLGKDITYDTSNPNNYTPIGGYYSNVKNFLGHFDGDGHTISGVRINDDYPSDVGLFGRLGNGAEVKNLTLDDAIIYGPTKTGGIAGTNSGGTITNCHVTSSVKISASTNDVIYHGGIVGSNSEKGTVSYCTSSATIERSNGSCNYYGVIAGSNESNCTLDHNLAFGADLPKTTAFGYYYGAITGRNNGILKYNYYSQITFHYITQSSDDGHGCGSQDGSIDVPEDDGAISAIIYSGLEESVNPKTGSKIAFRREFTGGTASTIVLPFDYTPAGEGTYYTFSGVEKNYETNRWEAKFESTSSSINANYPYLFKPDTNTEYVLFNGTANKSDIPSTTIGDWTFLGTYTIKTWKGFDDGKPRNAYGFAAQEIGSIHVGDFVKIGEYVRLRPMRCYMEYTPTSSTRAESLTDEELPETIRVILVDDGGKTDIGSLSTKTGIITFDSDAWYSLDGKRFSTQPAQKGIYVNNGKKVVIK